MACLNCGQPFSNKNVFTEAGWRETKISGFCESCFDKLFAETSDEGADESDPYGGWETGPDFEDGF